MYSDEYYLACTVVLAIAAYEEGFSPVGAVLVDGDTGQILKEAKSCREPGNVKHAEYQILKDDVPQKDNLILYTTMEPCIMCMGLATVARIRRVVWLVNDRWAGASKVYDYDKSLYVRERLPETERITCGLTQYATDLWAEYLEGIGAEDKNNTRLVLGELMIPIYVITNDKHLWLVQGFAYLFNKYWGDNQQVTVVGFNPPQFEMPDNFTFHSLGNTNKPAGEWSNKLITLLDLVDTTHFILFLEDFWLIEQVDLDCVRVLIDWMENHPEALRMDLWRERQAKKQAVDFETIRDYQIVETPSHTKYQMSLQANIWNRDLLRQVLIPNESPWQVEIDGTQRLAKRSGLRVFGTRNSPVKYEPVHQKGQFNVSQMRKQDVVYMRGQGWLDAS